MDSLVSISQPSEATQKVWVVAQGLSTFLKCVPFASVILLSGSVSPSPLAVLCDLPAIPRLQAFRASSCPALFQMSGEKGTSFIFVKKRTGYSTKFLESSIRTKSGQDNNIKKVGQADVESILIRIIT